MWGALQNAAKIATAAVENSDQLLGNLTNQATKLLENLDREYQSDNEEESNDQLVEGEGEKVSDKLENVNQSLPSEEMNRKLPTSSSVSLKQPPVPVVSKKIDDAWDDIDNLLNEQEDEDELEEVEAIESKLKSDPITKSDHTFLPVNTGNQYNQPPIESRHASTNYHSSYDEILNQNKEKIFSLNNQVEQLLKSNSLLKSALDESKQITEQLQSDLTTTQTENIYLQQLISNQKLSISQLTEDQKMLESTQQNQMKEWKSIIHKLQNELNSSNQVNDQMKNEMDSKVKEVNRLKFTVEDLSRKIQSQNVSILREKLEEVKNLRDGLREEVSSSLQSLTSEMAEAMKNIAVTLTKATEVQQQRQQQQQSHPISDHHHHHNQITSLENELAAVNSDLEIARKMEGELIETYQKKLQDMALSMEVSQLQSQPCEPKDRIKELETQVISLEKVIDELMNQKKPSVNTTNTSIAASSTTTDDFEIERNELKAEILYKQGVFDELLKEKDSIIKNKENELLHLKAIYEESQIKLEKAREKIHSLRDQLKKQHENHKLEISSMIQNQSDSSSYISRIEEVEIQLKLSTDELEHAKSQIQTYLTEINQLRNSINQLQLLKESSTDISTMNETLNSMETKLNVIIHENDELKSEIESQKEGYLSQLDNLRNELMIQSDELAILRNHSVDSSEIIHLRETIEEVSSALSDQKQKNNVLTQLVNEKDIIISQIRSSINSLEKSLTDKTNEVTILLMEKQEIMDTLKQSQNTYDSKIHQLHDEITRINDLNDKLVVECTTLRSNLVEVTHNHQSQYVELSNQFETSEKRFLDKTIENASLHEEVRNLSESLKQSQNEVIVLNSKISVMSTSLSSLSLQYEKYVKESQLQIDTYLEEIRFKTSQLSDLEAKNKLLSSNLSKLETTLSTTLSQENQLRQQVEELMDYKRRAEVAEEALGKQDEKKKRDLEFLRKQNEQIALLQRDKSDLEQKASVILSEYNSKIQDLQNTIENIQIEKLQLSQTIQSLSDENEKLKNTKGKGNNHSHSHSSHHQHQHHTESVTSSDGEASYEMIDPNRSIASSSTSEGSSDLSPIVVVGTDDEISSISKQLKDRLASLEQDKLALSEEIIQLKQFIEDLQQQLEKSKSIEQSKDLEIKALLVKQNQIEQKISRLDDERTRLERDLHYYETSATQGSSDVSTTGKQRQRPERQVTSGSIESGIDLESGGQSGDMTGYGDDEDEFEMEKKGEVGVHPILVKLWDLLR